ncbi:hypothetical protein [Cricetibacter osteomyelitidis]|nr:hypothetical protein [Cricetibacter osteomyelitidis]
MVTSASMLEMGTFPRCQFDQRGGIVGSAKNADWYINNLKNEIENIEFEIRFYNGDYCLLAYSRHIFINRTTVPVPVGAVIRLKNDDIISIANYDLRVQIYTERSDNVNLQDDLYHLVKTTDAMLLSADSHQYMTNNLDDNVTAPTGNELLTLKREQFELDPLHFLENEVADEMDMLSQIAAPDSIDKAQYYKIINEYINTNIESYEPSILSEEPRVLPVEPHIPSSIYHKVEIAENLTKSTALLDETENKEPAPRGILDPLFFIK